MEIHFDQILFQIINFSVVVGALTYLLYKPVLKILEERAEKIAEAQKQAEQMLKETAEVEEMKKSAKKEAQKEAAAIVDEARAQAQKQKSEIMAQAKKDALVEIEKMKADWHSQQEAQLKSMQKDFADAVVAVSEKVLGAAIDKKAHAKLIDTELDAIIKSM